MEIKTIADIGDIIICNTDDGREIPSRIIRIDIFSMDRGCYACEYTLDLKRCKRNGDEVIEENVVVPEHLIKNNRTNVTY